MAAETASLEMYRALLDMDNQLHSILSNFRMPAKKVTLSQLQQHISALLPGEVEDTTELIRSFREKEYEQH